MAFTRASLGAALKVRRLALGLTQARTAGLAGLSKSFLSEIEGGRRGITIAKLLSLAQALDTRVGALIGEDEPERRSEPAGNEWVSLEVEISPQVLGYLEQLLRTGLYGFNVGEVAERLLVARLSEMVAMKALEVQS